jgi:hypothetical protein
MAKQKVIKLGLPNPSLYIDTRNSDWEKKIKIS